MSNVNPVVQMGDFDIEQLSNDKIKITCRPSGIEAVVISQETRIGFDSEQVLTAILSEEGIFCLELNPPETTDAEQDQGPKGAGG